MKKIPKLMACALVLAITGCEKSQPADTGAAEQKPAVVTLAPEPGPQGIIVTPVSADGKPVGEPRTLQLTPEIDPAAIGLTPVPAGEPVADAPGMVAPGGGPMTPVPASP